MRSRPIVALIYDFDGTLSPGNMQPRIYHIRRPRVAPREYIIVTFFFCCSGNRMKYIAASTSEDEAPTANACLATSS